MLNPRMHKILTGRMYLKKETFRNKNILVEHKIFCSWKFKIAPNSIKENNYTKMVKLQINHTISSSKNGSTDYTRYAYNLIKFPGV